MNATIAVVEDDEAVLDSLKLVLEAEGWHVRAYSTGEEFLADPLSCDSACVVLDPHLPGLTGADLARAMVQADCHVPIVGFSARPSSAVALAMLDVGACAMLSKPTTAEEIYDQLRAVIGNSGDRKCFDA